MDLWLRWSEHYEKLGIDPQRICKDGIINQEEYLKAPKKVLFVMKEVNDWPGGDLREMLAEGPKYQMWHSTARWAAGIIHDFPHFSEVDNYPRRREAIRQVAVINLKKTSGGPYSKMSVINAYAFKDRELLLRQIEEIAPEIIVACGTFNSLIWLLELDIDPDNPIGKPTFDSTREAFVVPWRHPGRANNAKMYAQLRMTFKRLQGHS